MNNKVVLIGCGNVGMSYAYALLNQRTFVNELALIDLDEERIEGEVMDLNHCLAFAPSKIKIKVGTYEDCRDANIIVIAAGAYSLIREVFRACLEQITSRHCATCSISQSGHHTVLFDVITIGLDNHRRASRDNVASDGLHLKCAGCLINTLDNVRSHLLRIEQNVPRRAQSGVILATDLNQLVRIKREVVLASL